jgi:uncharacterized protein (TIGR03435 family)
MTPRPVSTIRRPHASSLTRMRPLLLLATLACARLAISQDVRPAFDVASVKLATRSASGGYRHQITPGGITMLHVSLGYCIRTAWSLRYSYELIGPGWLDPPTDVLVDIAARTAEPATEDQVKQMLQTLLMERFKLVSHAETRQLPSYSLVTIGKNPALRRSEGNGGPKSTPGAKPYSQAYRNFSMAQLALQLGPPMTSRPVVDKTGIEGSFDFELDYGPYIIDRDSGKPITDVRGAVDTEGSAIQALRDQLGLALKSDRAPYNVLVIDHVEKTAAGN